MVVVYDRSPKQAHQGGCDGYTYRGRGVLFVDAIAVKLEPYVTEWQTLEDKLSDRQNQLNDQFTQFAKQLILADQYLSLTVSVHKFPQRGSLLNFEVDDCSILWRQEKVSVLQKISWLSDIINSVETTAIHTWPETLTLICSVASSGLGSCEWKTACMISFTAHEKHVRSICCPYRLCICHNWGQNGGKIYLSVNRKHARANSGTQTARLREDEAPAGSAGTNMAGGEDCFKHSASLFLKDNGAEMKFYMRPCEMKARIRPLVEVSSWSTRYFRIHSHS